MSTSTTAAAEKAEMFETLTVVTARLVSLMALHSGAVRMGPLEARQLHDLRHQIDSLIATLIYQGMDR